MMLQDRSPARKESPVAATLKCLGPTCIIDTVVIGECAGLFHFLDYLCILEAT